MVVFHAMNDQLTDAQNEALEEAWNILKEQFDHLIVAYETECKEGTDRTFDCVYHGGLVAALGLVEGSKQQFKKQLAEGDTTDD